MNSRSIPGSDRFSRSKSRKAYACWLRTTLSLTVSGVQQLGLTTALATFATNVRLGAGFDLEIDSGGAADPKVMANTVDPSAAAGIAAPEGSVLGSA